MIIYKIFNLQNERLYTTDSFNDVMKHRKEIDTTESNTYVMKYEDDGTTTKFPPRKPKNDIVINAKKTKQNNAKISKGNARVQNKDEQAQAETILIEETKENQNTIKTIKNNKMDGRYNMENKHATLLTESGLTLDEFMNAKKYTTKELATILIEKKIINTSTLEYGMQTIKNWIRKGRINAIRLGGKVFIMDSELKKLF